MENWHWLKSEHRIKMTAYQQKLTLRIQHVVPVPSPSLKWLAYAERPFNVLITVPIQKIWAYSVIILLWILIIFCNHSIMSIIVRTCSNDILNNDKFVTRICTSFSKKQFTVVQTYMCMCKHAWYVIFTLRLTAKDTARYVRKICFIYIMYSNIIWSHFYQHTHVYLICSLISMFFLQSIQLPLLPYIVKCFSLANVSEVFVAIGKCS